MSYQLFCLYRYLLCWKQLLGMHAFSFISFALIHIILKTEERQSCSSAQNRGKLPNTRGEFCVAHSATCVAKVHLAAVFQAPP